MWETRGIAREGNWRRMSRAGAGSDGPYPPALMAAEQLLRSETLELEGHSGRGGEGERRCSRRENAAPKRDWLTADVHGCFLPSGRFPEINPQSSPVPPSSSLPAPPHRHHVAQRARGGSLSCASSETGRGSAWAPSSAAAYLPSRRFYPDTKASRLCSHRSGQSRGPRTLNHRPGPERSESSPGNAPLSCCENTCVDQPVYDECRWSKNFNSFFLLQNCTELS